jgi:hypothetical protein
MRDYLLGVGDWIYSHEAKLTLFQIPQILHKSSRHGRCLWGWAGFVLALLLFSKHCYPPTAPYRVYTSRLDFVSSGRSPLTPLKKGGTGSGSLQLLGRSGSNQ